MSNHLAYQNRRRRRCHGCRYRRVRYTTIVPPQVYKNLNPVERQLLVVTVDLLKLDSPTHSVYSHKRTPHDLYPGSRVLLGFPHLSNGFEVVDDVPAIV